MYFPLTRKCFLLTGKCFLLTNFPNDTQTQESLKNDFPETTLWETNMAYDTNIIKKLEWFCEIFSANQKFQRDFTDGITDRILKNNNI